MPQSEDMERLFEAATTAFPYLNLKPTSITQGELETGSGEVEYAEGFTFEVGRLLDEPLVGGGWIELARDGEDGEVSVTAFFAVSRNGDWEKERILPDELAVQGVYDLGTKSWEFWVEPY